MRFYKIEDDISKVYAYKAPASSTVTYANNVATATTVGAGNARTIYTVDYAPGETVEIVARVRKIYGNGYNIKAYDAPTPSILNDSADGDGWEYVSLKFTAPMSFDGVKTVTFGLGIVDAKGASKCEYMTPTVYITSNRKDLTPSNKVAATFVYNRAAGTISVDSRFSYEGNASIEFTDPVNFAVKVSYTPVRPSLTYMLHGSGQPATYPYRLIMVSQGAGSSNLILINSTTGELIKRSDTTAQVFFSLVGL